MTSNRRHDQLGQTLRAEAAASEPPFSESLHCRVMDALAAEQPERATIAHPATRRAWPLAAAAAVVLGSGLVVYLAAHHSAEVVQVAAVPQRMQVPTPGEIVNQAAGPLLQGLGDLNSRTYAAVDTDARNLARFMARQLDFSAPAARVQ